MPKVKSLLERQQTEPIRKLRDAVRNAMLDKEICQYELARMSGLSVNTIGYALKDPSRVTLRNFLKICTVLGVEVTADVH